MPFETIQIGSKTFKVDEQVASMVLEDVRAFAEEFSPDVCFSRMERLSRDVGNVLDSIRSHPTIIGPVTRYLDDVIINHPQVFEDHFRCHEFPVSDGNHVLIPDEFRTLMDIDGMGVGKGEVIVPLLFKNNVEWLPAFDAYDFRIDGIPWHFKDHRNTDSTPVGRTKGSEEFYETPVMKFIRSLSVNIYAFGNREFKDNTLIEDRVKERYGTDINHAAFLFEEELQTEFRRSPCFGEAKGILYLKQNDASGLFIERVDLPRICFHSNGGRGFKACSVPNRFADAILSRTLKQRTDDEHQRERELKELERRSLVEETRKKKKEEIERFRALRSMEIENKRRMRLDKLRQLRDTKAIQRQDERARKVDRFVEAFKMCDTIKATAKMLSISTSTASELKKKAISMGLLGP